ncbi:aliphatic sulfonate ABC transporter substrate-binding protein [Dactylosporangium sp. NPDC049525]|uniref:aliphatic sulfonate ABC transporter substrate-binding protein n=1 Tax=Dactylosporangium sp. NPDC049525 TaxID=3154730 RepID=UPI0034290204
MKISRRSFATVLAAATLIGVAGCGSDEPAKPGEPTKVTFGYIGDYNGTSLLAVADKQGLWKKYGIDATVKVFTNGPVQVQALQSGDLDFGYIGPGAFWLPASGQAKIIGINTLGAADRVIAQPGITSIQQLRGKKVGVPEGTSGDMILTLALQAAGMTNKDIQRVPLDASTLVSAFSSKQIDAAGFWYPAIATIKKTVPDLVELAKNDDFTSKVSFPNAFVAGNKVVAEKAAAVTKVIQVLREATDYRAAHPDETVAATAEMLKQQVDAVKADAANSKALTTQELDAATKDGTVGKWLTGMGDFFVSAGKLKEPVDPKTYYLGDLWTGAAVTR